MLLIYLLGGKNTVIVFLLWLLSEISENMKNTYLGFKQSLHEFLNFLFWVIFRHKHRSIIQQLMLRENAEN